MLLGHSKVLIELRTSSADGEKAGSAPKNWDKDEALEPRRQPLTVR